MKFRRSFTLILLASLLAALLGLVRVPSAHAQSTITITDCTDDTQLRSTINKASSGDTITFGCSGTIPITVANGPLVINTNLTLDSSGQSVTLDGQNQVQVLSVGGVTFTLNALTVAHGLASSNFGGGLFNQGTVNITNSTFANNSAPGGGGLYNSHGSVTIITNSTFANNLAAFGGGGGGGGLLNAGNVSISNSTFVNNSADDGGGLYNSFGSVSISNSTFAANSTKEAGGLFNDGGSVSISNSTFANNTADLGGGGIFNNDSVSISNSTFANNSAGFFGGGIENVGGIFNNDNVSIGGSIVANNTANFRGNCIGGVSDQGYNLESGSDCGFTGMGDLQNTDPQLDPTGLQNNGGPTQTIALLATSPAIDHVPAATCPATDQRGVTRLPGERCDIGAFEFPDTTPPTLHLPSPITVDATSPAGAVVRYTVTATDDDGDPLAANCAPASGSTFPIGTTTVNCSASEPGSNTASGSFQVTVKGAAAQISDLINTVNGFGLSKGLQTSLDAKLQDALSAINAGQTATACSDLTDFIGQVQAQSGKGISTSQAQTLIAAAQQIQAVLGC